MATVPLDESALGFLAERAERTAAEFGAELGSKPPPLLAWGEGPEYRAGGSGALPTIFVSHDADWWQVRYQIAHEVFHWLCTPPRTFHWSHELLAVETAVRAMGELGEHAYVETLERSLAAQAERLPLAAMLTTPFGDEYPDGLYGRAWLTGRRLEAAAGWEELKPLAASFGEDGRPDVAAWVQSLRVKQRAAVEAVLGEPSAGWV